MQPPHTTCMYTHDTRHTKHTTHNTTAHAPGMSSLGITPVASTGTRNFSRSVHTTKSQL